MKCVAIFFHRLHRLGGIILHLELKEVRPTSMHTDKATGRRVLPKQSLDQGAEESAGQRLECRWDSRKAEITVSRLNCSKIVQPFYWKRWNEKRFYIEQWFSPLPTPTFKPSPAKFQWVQHPEIWQDSHPRSLFLLQQTVQFPSIRNYESWTLVYHDGWKKVPIIVPQKSATKMRQLENAWEAATGRSNIKIS